MSHDQRHEWKWSCEYCTYENFRASKRCTLCRATRPPQLITSPNQDIYKMTPLIAPPSSDSNIAAISNNSSSSSSTSSSSSNDLSKWPCPICTFLNWQRAAKCTQCLTPRKKMSPSGSRSAHQRHEKIQPLSVNVNIAESAGSCSSRSTPRRNSPHSPEAARVINNDINRPVVPNCNRGSGPKWMCHACTYENWPKAYKCALCGTTKGRTISDCNLASGGVHEFEGGNRSGRTSCGVAESYQDTASASAPYYDDDKNEERQLCLLRKRLCDKDWLWLNACMGVVDGDALAVEEYVTSGGDPARQLTTDEVAILNRPSALEVGHTLVHLGIRFKREDMLAVLLTATDVAAKAVKRLPVHTSPDLATDIRREIAVSLRQRKGDFPCFFITECITFALPTDIEDLPRHVQSQLFDELLDRDVQNELEEECILNWNVEVTERLGSRLYCLWNRTAGDCLLDSVLQATWGVFDIDNTLRRAMADSLTEGAMTFYPRWKEYETQQARSLHFSLDEIQCQRDWDLILSLASQPGAALEQSHIFALAHILRRPIIVYGVKYIKSFRGETIGFAKFQGVYLPLLWERSFCWKIPLVLGYTRGHFSALVPVEMDTDDSIGAGANSTEDAQTAYLPLVDNEGKLLPVHFLTGSEVGREDSILREWLDCLVTKGGILVALQKLGKRPTLVKQMVDKWLDHYRQLAIPTPHTTFSSDGESDQE